MPSASPSSSHLLDLDDLESEGTPLFVIKIGEITPEFDILFSNQSFRTLGLRTSILAQGRAPLLFRSWAQAVRDFKPEYEFSDRIWTAEYAGRSGDWKIIKAVNSKIPEQDQEMLDAKADEDGHFMTDQSSTSVRPRTHLITQVEQEKLESLKNLPSTNLNARWESIQTMMEMSDVGVFEYNSQGKLVHANEAWYRLRYVQQRN